MNSCFCRKVQRQMFLFFPAAIFVPLKGTPTWRSINLGEYFSKDLAYEISHRPDSCRGFLYICLLLFPRFCTFCIEWFATLTHISQPFLCKIGMGRRHTPFRQPPFSCLAIRCDLWQAWFKIRNFLSGLTALSTKHFSSKSRKQRIRLSCSSSNFLTIIRRASILSVHGLQALKLICWSHILWSTASFNLKKYLRLNAFSGTESIEIPLYFFSTSR